MSSKHITNFNIKNFKKFDTLEVKNIGQINLIVGDNNVGKTCLLEALLFDSRPKNTINWYYQLLLKRKLIVPKIMQLNEANAEWNYEQNDFSYYQRDKKEPIHFVINNKRFSISNILEEIYISNDARYKKFVEEVGLFDYDGIRKKSKNWIVFEEEGEIRYLLDLISDYYYDFINNPDNNKIPTIPAIMLNDEIEKYLSVHYEKIIIKNDLKDKISKLVQLIFPNMEIIDIQQEVEEITFRNSKIFIKTTERKNFHNIREYGEGFVRVLSIIFHILNNDTKKIVIDEIDTGIHYSKMENFLSAIIKLCVEMDIQLFATTHSEDSIKWLVRAGEKLNQSDALRLIKLKEMDNQQVKAITYSFDEYEYLVKSETEVR